MTMPDESRVLRLEEKVDILFSQHYKCEEQMAAVVQRNNRFEKRLDDQEDDLRELTAEVWSNSHSVKAAERFFWVGVATVASAIGYLIR